MSFAFTVEGQDAPPTIVDDPSPVELPINDGSSLVCSICGKSDFETLRGYKIHQTRMHGVGGDSSPKTKRSSSKTASMEDGILGFYVMMGAIANFFNKQDGAIILANAQQCAEAWDQACRQNEAVRKVWVKITTVSVWGAVMTAHAPIVMGIMANHQMMPESVAKLVEATPSDNGVATAESAFHTVDGGYVE